MKNGNNFNDPIDNNLDRETLIKIFFEYIDSLYEIYNEDSSYFLFNEEEQDNFYFNHCINTKILLIKIKIIPKINKFLQNESLENISSVIKSFKKIKDDLNDKRRKYDLRYKNRKVKFRKNIGALYYHGGRILDHILISLIKEIERDGSLDRTLFINISPYR